MSKPRRHNRVHNSSMMIKHQSPPNSTGLNIGKNGQCWYQCGAIVLPISNEAQMESTFEEDESQPDAA